jgi:YHS domain-containing protein
MKTKITTFIIAALAACAASAAEVKPYPSDVCIVSGNKLGSMGTPVTIVHNGQEVKFCCKPCVAKFKKDPEKYLKKIAPKEEAPKNGAPKKEETKEEPKK